MGDPSETILNLVIVGVALFAGAAILLPLVGNLSSTLSNLGGGAAAAQPAAGTPVTTVDQNGNPVPAPAPAPLPTNTGNPLTDLLNSITNANNANQPGAQVPVPPVSTANPSLCHSKYNGKCDTECKGGVNDNCRNCRIACGLSANLAMVDDIYEDDDMPMPIGYYVTMG